MTFKGELCLQFSGIPTDHGFTVIDLLFMSIQTPSFPSKGNMSTYVDHH